MAYFIIGIAACFGWMFLLLHTIAYSWIYMYNNCIYECFAVTCTTVSLSMKYLKVVPILLKKALKGQLRES